MQDPHLLKDIQRAFLKSEKEGVLDLDKVLFRKDSFNLIRLEDLYVETKGVIPPFRQSEFFVLFVKQGAGTRSVGQYSFPIKNNSLVIVTRRMIHAAKYTSRPEGYLITFRPDFFLQQSFSYKLLQKRVFGSLTQPYVVLTESQAKDVADLFEKIIEECDSGFEEKRQMIALKVLELLILCDRFFGEMVEYDTELTHSRPLETFQELIESHFTQHRDVHFYAEALHTHPNNLNHIVKKATGLTAKQIITNRLIIEAKYLLASTELSIKEIAFELGFEDPNYFTTFFRKEQNASPAQYRSKPV